MKKYIFSILTLFVVALCGLSLTGCSDDDLGTNQYKKGVALNVFGPSPVVRGGTLRFLGSNLDQVTQVIIPGVDPITNIEVIQAGIPSEIRVVVPKDGPEVGKIQLVTKTEKVLTTQTELTYTEDIELEGFAPAMAMPGDEITITGDYLNLIHMVEFTDGVQVGEKEFTAHDRYAIKVKVPEEARTGKISLYDLDLTDEEVAEDDVTYNIITSETALIVGTPTPAKLKGREEVNAQGTITAKQGETITVTGTSLNLVAAVAFNGAEGEETTISKDGKTITTVLPATAADGEISLICKSGVEVPVGTLTTVKPSEMAATPNPAKNGTDLTINGKDLDVVVGVTFPNADTNWEVKPAAASLAVTIPESAQDGDVTLHMANGQTVAVAYTLVKPVVTGYSSTPAAAGSELILSGSNLDLVASVNFGTSKAEATASVDGATLTVKVPLDGQSGAPVLNLKNGTTQEAPELTIDKPAFCYVPDPSYLTDNDLKAGDLLMIDADNVDVLTAVQIDGEDTKFLTNGSKLYVTITANAGTKSVLKLISEGVGDVEYALSVVPNTEKHTIIWTGAMQFMDWNGNQDLAYGAYDWSQVTPGTEMIIHATVIDPLVGWGCVSVRHGNGWSNVAGLPGQYDFNVNEADINIVVPLTQEVLADLCSNDGMIIMGHNFLLSSIELVEHISLETTVWEGYEDLGAWSAQPYIGEEGILEQMGAKAGQTLRIYVKPLADDWIVQAFHGHWNGQIGGDWKAENTVDNCIEIVLTDEELAIYNEIQNWGGLFVMQGQNAAIIKVTLE